MLCKQLQLSILVIYCLPVLFYFSVINVNEIDLNAIITSIAILGFLIGMFSVYDAYQANNGIISDYSRNAFDYIVQRKGGDSSNANSTQAAGYGSSGLLEMRPVSAAWVSLSAFAALSLIRKEAILIRVAIVCVYGFDQPLIIF